MDEQKIWILHKLNPEGRFTLKFGDTKATVCFSAEQKARDFAKAAGLDSQFVEMDGEFFVEWLRQLYKTGITHISKDPTDLAATRNLTPIPHVLMRVDMAQPEG